MSKSPGPTVIALAIAGLGCLTVATIAPFPERLPCLGAWIGWNTVAVVALRTRGGGKSRSPRFPARHTSLLAVALVGAVLMVVAGAALNGAVGCGATILLAGGITGWLYAPRIDAKRSGRAQ